MTVALKGRVVIATHNAGKLREMRDLLAPHGIDPVSAGDLGLPEPTEDGTMFAENALIKARAAAQGCGLPAIADDSGLCIAWLDGAPGLFTADWAGHPRDWMRAMTRAKDELERRGHAVEGAPCYFVSALAVVWPDGTERIFEGRCQGHLTWPPRGEHGFGYDPMFVPDGQMGAPINRTFAELTAEEKHGLPPHGQGLSHRARAFLALRAAVLAQPAGADNP